MPRVAEGRPPAEPQSQEQQERYRRILRAAARLGEAHGLERMQMNDVARESGVAIATLYRYFPSKTDLFVGVLHRQITQLSSGRASAVRSASRADAVADVLIGAAHNLLERPTLTAAMLQANNAAHLVGGRAHTAADAAFCRLLLDALGVREPEEEDLRMVRITEQTWYGVLASLLSGIIDGDQADDDVRLASRLLLSPRYDASPPG